VMQRQRCRFNRRVCLHSDLRYQAILGPVHP
jgi:hypothetical protein